MGLLAVIIFDSLSALNPILLIGSIISTNFSYFGLVLVFCCAALIIKSIGNVTKSQILDFILFCIHIYLGMVAAHLLGRFYFRYQEKLNWEA